ncbi:T9SS type A sorting domain-containing protein [Agriterribacter sp.]|uniref:T9SS type A sorting domain-containing protein n=1 Tax=Agriterribacter sp. TaxID=2821509 RepID=UPI002BFC57DF|nr:Ig-like domain-containing protein [Agriterribacter sp.]HTN05160.1 Ig-like domain-containing protein [Agriterribacter sp.]
MKQFHFLSSLEKGFLPFCFSLFLSTFFIAANAQAPDSKGKDFWLAFPGNYSPGTLSFFISGDESTTGTVSAPGTGFSINFTVTPGTVTTVTLPTGTLELNASNVIENKGIHIVAGKEVTVYGLNRYQATTDAYLALPTDILGTSYINLGYKNTNIVNSTQFGIVATQNATTVTITPTVTTNGRLAGIPYTITLNQGQTYLLRNTDAAPQDLSGTLITSNKPIAVFGGMQCANIPMGYVACDHIIEQLPPATAWGKNFISVPLKTRTKGDTFRFLASANNTTVEVNGSIVATLNKGQLFETILTTASQIKSNNPILVAQYSNSSSFDGVTSDPFMMLITPYEQFLGNYTFSTPASGFSGNYVNVVAPAAAVGTLKLDGVVIPAASFSPIGTTGFRGAQLNISLGSHTINGSNLPFGIFVYGYDSYDSYGYPGGQSLAPVASVTNLSITPLTGTGAVGTEHCLEALVKDQFNNPLVGVRVDFTITGANPGSTGFANTNASGIAKFCYTGANAGDDNIVASVGTISAPAKFTWTKTASNIYYSKAAGNLHDVLTWGVNLDGSGTNPTDFGEGKIFNLANRAGSYTMTGNWTVYGTLNNPSGSQLKINGYTLSITTLTGTGTLTGSTASNLSIIGANGGSPGNLNFTAGAGSSLKTFTLNRTGTGASATIGTALNIYDVLMITNGILNTANKLTLKSNATNTARVAPIGGSISGNVTVERYIPARRAWRLINAPVSGNQTVNQAWQEGVTTASANPNPAPGYGTYVTVGTVANGFDQNILGQSTSSLKSFTATGALQVVTNTKTATVANKPYFLFVRGDRSLTMKDNTVPANNTTLRASGPLLTGNQTIPVGASGFTAVANPFASPINFATITRTNVKNSFYVWDPKMGGTYGVGAYVNISYNGTGYDVTPASVSPESQYIQSGQGFLVQSTGAAGSIMIKESDKSATPAQNVFRKGDDGTDVPLFAPARNAQGLRINLQTINDSGTNILDEVFTSYSRNFSSGIDDMDAIKMPNVLENLAIIRQGQSLMVDRRSPVSEHGDTLYLNLSNTTQRSYILEFNPIDLTDVVSATIEDNYLHTSTTISTSEISQVYFQVNSDAASANCDRFKVVLSTRKAFTNAGVLGKSLIKAYPNPVINGNVNLQFENAAAGMYSLELVNSAGQVVLRRNIQHAGGSLTQQLNLERKLPAGIYQLRITGKDTRTIIKLLNK